MNSISKSGRAMSIALLLFLFLMPSVMRAQENTYPTKNRLFHIERSKNRNLVCYDAALSEEGTLDTRKPLEIYWINREENPGEKKGLSGLQRRMAYGYKLVSGGDDSAEVTLTAYSGRVLTIRKLGGKYVCTLTINDEPAILQSLYVKAKESNSLSVEYVELRGISIATRQSLVERVNNK